MPLDLDDDFDFGFSSVTAGELFSEKDHEVEDAQTKVERIYNAIMPLLDNLTKGAEDSPYIHWPNRIEKIEAFKKILKDIKDS